MIRRLLARLARPLINPMAYTDEMHERTLAAIEAEAARDETRGCGEPTQIALNERRHP